MYSNGPRENQSSSDQKEDHDFPGGGTAIAHVGGRLHSDTHTELGRAGVRWSGGESGWKGDLCIHHPSSSQPELELIPKAQGAACQVEGTA